MLINVPTFPVLVCNQFITSNSVNGYTKAYLVAVRCLKSRPLLFSLHLENGALYSGVPSSSIFGLNSTKSTALKVHEAQPWSCLESPANSLIYSHLKDYTVQINSPEYKGKGQYLFTIDYSGEGLAQDPEQHKTHNIIATDDGPLVAMPNNYCLFSDRYSTSESALEPKQLKRQTSYLLTY